MSSLHRRVAFGSTCKSSRSRPDFILGSVEGIPANFILAVSVEIEVGYLLLGMRMVV